MAKKKITRKPWTAQDDKSLTAMRAKGYTNTEIGTALKRTAGAVAMRVGALGLAKRKPGRRKGKPAMQNTGTAVHLNGSSELVAHAATYRRETVGEYVERVVSAQAKADMTEFVESFA